MYTPTLAAVAFAALAHADFHLYSQQSNDIVDSNGGGFQTQELLVSAGEVACGDGVAIPGQFYNDASDYSTYALLPPHFPSPRKCVVVLT